MADLREAHAKSREIWNAMAAGWEKHHDFIWGASQDVGKRLANMLDPKPGQTILDVAAGPGDTGFLAAERIGPAGKLLSTDFSPEMVEVARRAAKARGLDNVEHRLLDAQNMDLESNSVDGVLCRWGYMLMVDPAAALAETRRVLRPGGRLAFSVWGAPEKNAWVVIPGMLAVQRGYLEPVDPRGPGGMFSLADHDVIRQRVAGAGFSDVEITEQAITWPLPSFDDIWRFFTELAGAIAQLVRRLTDEQLAEFRTALREALEPLRKGDSYDLTGVTVNVVAK